MPMSYTNPQALVTTKWLAKNVNDLNTIVLDGTYHLPTVGRSAKTEFTSQHIEGAVFFDIDDICDKDSSLPHMLPSADLFSKKIGDLGIANDMHIVVYDVYGMQSAARTWWMFKVFGHDKVSILSGGLPKWIKEGNTASSVPSVRAPSTYICNKRGELVRNLEDIFANINNGKEQIIDARSKGRFNGLEPEPREGMRSGHMPGSISLPFTELLNPEDKTYLTGLEIKEKIKEAGIDLNKPIITTCGSGVTACSLSLGLFLIGKEDVAVYDGSWSEWGALQNTPVI